MIVVNTNWLPQGIEIAAADVVFWVATLVAGTLGMGVIVGDMEGVPAVPIVVAPGDWLVVSVAWIVTVDILDTETLQKVVRYHVSRRQ